MADQSDDLRMTGSKTSDTAKVQSDLVRNNRELEKRVERDRLHAAKGEERKSADQKNDRNK